MKKYKTTIALMLLILLSTEACKKFLTVIPKDSLTGNNFYRNKEDVEANIANMYSTFFNKINESWVIGSIGEARSGEIHASTDSYYYTASRVVEVLGKNDMLSVVNESANWKDNNYVNITKWDNYYQVIQSANILISKLNEGIETLTEKETKRYLAEATFIRCFTYFWMVRIYGDVVYYTDPYYASASPREDMITVINKCLADLESQKDNIDWNLGDPALKGARASRGSLVALLMHMNMWNAGFDKVNANSYYQKVANLGTELVNSGQYKLLPMTIEGWGQVIKGRSDESLFEFYRSINYNDSNNNIAPFAEFFLRWPYKFPRIDEQVSKAYYSADYMKKIFPVDIDDKRKDLWFEDMLSDDGEFVAKKFAYNVYASGNENKNPDNTFLIFRYADAILLWAEALAQQNNISQALSAINMIRERAGAPLYTEKDGTELPNYIFLERERELFGEGLRWFDLVRTKRVLSSEWVSHTLSSDQFNRRAWTWPIHRNALNNNPSLSLNEYWQSAN
ncbi:Starch-binding associating with outer membrane [bacterium A37T11]|nr:Starch-binding associating with outer membrane [bacterium A37T11]